MCNRLSDFFYERHFSQVGDQVKECHPGGKAVNPYMALVAAADGVMKLEALQDHQDEVICTKADLILSSFYDIGSSTGAIRHHGTVAVAGIALS